MTGPDALVSAGDEYPLHQSADWVRHVVESNRNFYDRNYFNLFPQSGELMCIFGMGQYPNLGVHDAFVTVAHGGKHHIVRASRPLTDRLDMAVGPIRIEIIEPLQRLRVVCDAPEHGVELDVEWQGRIPAFAEPGQFIRRSGRVLFDTQRFAQMGAWSGSLRVDGTEFDVTPDRWGGSRDRSWGIRPVGEKEPPGIQEGVSSMGGMWNYMPIMFDDHAILYMCNEEANGLRPLEEGVRVWSDPGRPAEILGRPEHEHRMTPGTRMLEGSTIRFPAVGIELECEPMHTNFVAIGTGYGLDADWGHGRYQGPELVVQGIVQDDVDMAGLGQYGIIDHAGRFTYDGNVGYGLYEHGFFGPFPAYGLHDRGDTAPLVTD